MTVLIAGGGVAGCTSAIGLRRLGYDVLLITRPRPFAAYEGLSQRSFDALSTLGCIQAAATVFPPSARFSVWNGEAKQANREYLIYRPDFDRALLEDVRRNGVGIIEGSVIGTLGGLASRPSCRIKTSEGFRTIDADAAIDARGRFVPARDAYVSGPPSVSILQKLTLPPSLEPATSLHSIRRGWMWQAALPNGAGYLQLTTDAKTAGAIRNFATLRRHMGHCDEAWIVEGSNENGKPLLRDATSRLHKEIVAQRVFYAGDAASAVDPLSGNGIFQTLAMTSVLPFVIHTVLNRDEADGANAIAFYRERVRDLFRRYTSTGRDFYRAETRYADEPFWSDRNVWQPILPTVSSVRIERRSVIIAPYVESKSVLITPSHPNGVRFFEGIDLVPIVEQLLHYPPDGREKNFTGQSRNLEPILRAKLFLWLKENTILS